MFHLQKSILFFLCCFFFLPVYGQQEDAYALLSKLSRTTKEADKIKIHCQLTKLYTQNSPKEAQKHAEIALLKVKNLKNDSLRFEVYDAVIFYLSRKPNPDLQKATVYLRKVNLLDTNAVSPSKSLLLYENEGLIHTQLDAYEEAQLAFNKMLGLATRIGDKRAQGEAYLLMGQLFNRAQQPVSARDYFVKSADLYRKLGYTWGLSQALLGQSEALYQLNDLTNAIKAVQQASMMAHRANRFDLEAAAFRLDGLINLGLKKEVAALASLEQAKIIAQRLRDKQLTAQINLEIAKIRIHDNPQAAIALLDEAIPQFAKQTAAKELSQAYLLMYKYHKKNKSAQTILWLERYMVAKENLNAAEKKLSLERNKIRFATVQKEKDNERLRSLTASSQYEVQRQKFFNLLLFSFLLITCIITGAFYYYLRLRKLQAIKLETEVADRTAEISHVNEQLQASAENLERTNKELERFAYIASHDLKSPLRNIISYLTLIQRKLSNEADNDLNQFLDFAVKNAKHMNSLIDDVLEFSKLDGEKNAPKPVPVDSNEVLLQTVFNLQSIISSKRATITTTQLPTILGNEIRISQLFQNLIGNGVKYNNNPNPGVTISHQIVDGKHQFRIQDNGIGMSPEYHEQVFEMFRRLHRQDEYSGTGIGLAICKKIVEKAGGKIWLDSALNQGSTFYFTWPIHQISLN